MQGKLDWKSKMTDELTDAEITSAIRYLDPGPSRAGPQKSDGSVLIACLDVLFLVLGSIGLIWAARLIWLWTTLP
jgi:hypothetical protein